MIKENTQRLLKITASTYNERARWYMKFKINFWKSENGFGFNPEIVDNTKFPTVQSLNHPGNYLFWYFLLFNLATLRKNKF